MVKAEEDINKEIKKIQEKKWRMVADRLQVIKPVCNFSQKACRERFEALEKGTATPTPESEDNPSEETLARIQARKDKEAQIVADAGGIPANGLIRPAAQ